MNYNLIIMLSAFGWCFTVHTYIQDAVKLIPNYNILLPIKKVLMCTRCFTFNFSFIFIYFTQTQSLITTIGQASVACVLASLIHNQFK